MDHFRQLDERLAIADQPSEAELEPLKEQGFVAVVNLRRDGEPNQPLSTEAEGQVVRDLGLNYHHYAVGGQPLDRAEVEAVSQFLQAQSGPVLLHCLKGARAAALVLLHKMHTEGLTKQQTWEQAEAMDLKFGDPLRGLVEAYVDHHAAR